MKICISDFEVANNLKVGDSYTQYLKAKGKIPQNHIFVGYDELKDCNAVVIRTLPWYQAYFYFLYLWLIRKINNRISLRAILQQL